MTDEELADEMERRGLSAIAAVIRRPVDTSLNRPLEETCPWLVEDGLHVNGRWIVRLPPQLRAA